MFDLGVTYFSKLGVSFISVPRIMNHSLIHSLVLLVFVLLFNGCIRVLPKNEEKITFSNTIELEVSSSDWLFWRGPSGAGVSTQSKTCLWIYLSLCFGKLKLKEAGCLLSLEIDFINLVTRGKRRFTRRFILHRSSIGRNFMGKGKK